MILRYIDFINENSHQDEVLDLYNYFIRILKLHENHFYNDNKISSSVEFKKDINLIFHKLMIKEDNVRTEELYNKVSEYERKLYNDSKMTPDDNFGCSIWDICDVIIEDPDTLNINTYIQDFSEDDIYVEKEANWTTDGRSKL